MPTLSSWYRQVSDEVRRWEVDCLVVKQQRNETVQCLDVRHETEGSVSGVVVFTEPGVH